VKDLFATRISRGKIECGCFQLTDIAFFRSRIH
jgi:hypothetical protein